MRRQISPCHSLPGSLCSDSAASLTFQPANLLTCQRSSLPVTKPFICHRSAKSAAKSNPCHTSKNPLPQVQSVPHLPTPPPLPFQNRHRPATFVPLFWFSAFRRHLSAVDCRLSLFPYFLLGATNVQTKVLSFPHRPR